MFKRYILLTVLFSLFFSFESKGQCVNLSFDNCVTYNQTINLGVDNNVSTIWTTTSPSNSTYNSTFTTSQSIQFNEIGVWTINTIQTTPFCNNTFQIEIFNSPILISTTPLLNQCQGQTINILNNVIVSNASVLPLTYDFIINGAVTSDSIFTLIAGANTIDITVTDASGCTANSNMNINATSNSIVPPIYTITDGN